MGKKIIFRADGNSADGLGHLYRMFALIEIYKGFYETIFVTRQTSAISIIPESYNTILIPAKITLLQEPNWLSSNFPPEEHVIFIDGYHFDNSYQKSLREKAYFLVYIDDLVEGKMLADIVVNHSSNISESNYKKESYTKFALGTEYAILRPTFLEAVKEKRKIDNISSVFVCFGGADSLNLSLMATRALLLIDQIKDIHVVLGKGYLHKEMGLLEQENSQLQLHRNLSEKELYQVMMKCHMAVAPASTILYELCTITMPILSGYYIKNQHSLYKSLLVKGVISKGGDFTNYSISDFKDSIIQLLRNNNYNDYIYKQRELIDGNSKTRFIKLVNDSLISFRKATIEDIQQIFYWANDEFVRNNSYHSEPIIFSEHKKWFSSKLNDDKYLFLVALFDHTEAGIVRYEIKEEFAIVGITISKEFRGKRLAASFLDISSKEYFKSNELPILAYIKEKNKTSIKAFLSAGYKFYNKKIIDGVKSFIYKLEKDDVI